MKKITTIVVFLFTIILTSNAQSKLEKLAQKNSTYQKVRPDYKNALTSLLEKSGGAAMFTMAIDQLLGMSKQQKPNVPKKVWSEIKTDLSSSSTGELVELFAPIYQKYLNLSDLKGIIAFYNTPIGKKFASTTPLITKESMSAGQQWAMKLQGKIQSKIKEKGY